MITSPKPTRPRRASRYGEAIASLCRLAASGAIALLAIAQPIHATPESTRGRDVVGLAYESAPKVLLKAYDKALYQSSDQGRSWRVIEIPLPRGGHLSSVATSPAREGVIYVSGEGVGVLRTDDGGKTWTARTEGLPTRDVVAVAAHTTQPDTVYAVVEGSGTYRSQDAGKTWRLMDRTAQKGLRQLIHTNMPGSMQTGWLYAATSQGVRRSMDCFCLWQDAGQIGSNVYGVTFDPDEPKRLLAATAKGLLRSTDGGESWASVKTPPSDIVSVVSARSGAAFAIDKDGNLYRSEDGGESWTRVHA